MNERIKMTIILFKFLLRAFVVCYKKQLIVVIFICVCEWGSHAIFARFFLSFWMWICGIAFHRIVTANKMSNFVFGGINIFIDWYDRNGKNTRINRHVNCFYVEISCAHSDKLVLWNISLKRLNCHFNMNAEPIK